MKMYKWPFKIFQYPTSSLRSNYNNQLKNIITSIYTLN